MAGKGKKPPIGADFRDEDFTRSGRPRRRKKDAAANEATEAETAETGEKPKSAAIPEVDPLEEEFEEQDKETARVASVLLFAIGVFFALVTLFKGADGWRSIHRWMLGVFGVTAISVPSAMIASSILVGKRSRNRGKYIWLMIFFVVVLSSAVQIYFVGDLPGYGFRKNISLLYKDGVNFKGGGVISMLIAGILLRVLGRLGASIVIALLIFVSVLLLTGKDIFDFLRLLAKPFIFMGQCLSGIHNVFMGGDFEDAFDVEEDEDDREKRSFDEDIEAIEMVNSRGDSIDLPIYGLVNKAEPTKKTSEKTKEQDDFSRLFDIPIPAEKKPKEKKSQEDSELDALITRAAEKKARQDEAASGIKKEEKKEEPQLPLYILPGLDLLTPPDINSNSAQAAAEMREKADIIVNTLKSFGVEVKIKSIYRGPSITRYEIQPGAGVKVSKIKGLEDDIALSLAAQGVRIEAPIPGKAAVGIEVPNINKDTVTIREMLSTQEFRSAQSKLTFAVGKDITGNAIIGDITKMPHVIIAGTTGSGKSVCTRSIIMSILYKATPDEVKIILIDPKVVEFKVFEGTPHLLIPIVTEAKKAAGALNWAVNEMMRRYNTFADIGANDLRSYNEIADEDEEVPHMPQIVIFIDELADMMLVAGKEVEDSICRLAQMGRAAGIHLVVATQRPTTDVITGLIKANIPSRIALSVKSQVDSRTIIDMAGADKLLGNGDMLYMPIGTSKPIRVQGCFASNKDINETLNFIRAQVQGSYDNSIIDAVENFIPQGKGDHGGGMDGAIEAGSDEEYLVKAAEVAVNLGQISITLLQRKLKLGYARASRIMDDMEERGIVGPTEGAKPRKVLMSKMQFDEWKMRMLDS